MSRHHHAPHGPGPRTGGRARPPLEYASKNRCVPSLQRLEDRVTPTLGTFELDANATTQTTHDWDQVYNDAVLHPGQNTSGSISGAVFFKHDQVNTLTDDVFIGGQPRHTKDPEQ